MKATAKDGRRNDKYYLDGCISRCNFFGNYLDIFKLMSDKKSYRIDEVAKEFDVSSRTIKRWIQSGELNAVKIGHTRRITSEQLAEAKKKDGQLVSIRAK